MLNQVNFGLEIEQQIEQLTHTMVGESKGLLSKTRVTHGYTGAVCKCANTIETCTNSIIKHNTCKTSTTSPSSQCERSLLTKPSLSCTVLSCPALPYRPASPKLFSCQVFLSYFSWLAYTRFHTPTYTNANNAHPRAEHRIVSKKKMISERKKE